MLLVRYLKRGCRRSRFRAGVPGSPNSTTLTSKSNRSRNTRLIFVLKPQLASGQSRASGGALGFFAVSGFGFFQPRGDFGFSPISPGGAGEKIFFLR